MTDDPTIVMPAVPGPPTPRMRRWRPATVTVVRILTAAVVFLGLLACVSIAATVVLYLEIADTQDRVVDVQVKSIHDRRRASEESCDLRNDARTDMRKFVRALGVDPASLPRGIDGRPLFAAYPKGYCRAFAQRAVPDRRP